MLRWVHIARLAFHHSPEKEQRLLSRVLPNSRNTNDAGGFENTENGYMRTGKIGDIQHDARKKMAFLNDLSLTQSTDEQTRNPILSTFFDEHRDFMRHYPLPENVPQDQALDFFRREFEKELNEMTKRSLEAMGPTPYFYSESAFLEKYMRDTLRLPSGEAISQVELTDFKNSHYIPSAFITGSKMYFDMTHPDFNAEKRLADLQKNNPDATLEDAEKIVERNRTRTVEHEITHYCLDRVAKYGTSIAETLGKEMATALGVKNLPESPAWNELHDAVDAAFLGKFDGNTEVDYLHEAIAISMAGERTPYAQNDPRTKVFELMKNLRVKTAKNPKVREILEAFDKDVSLQLKGDGKFESPYDFTKRKMDIWNEEKQSNFAFKDGYEKHEATRHADPGHTQDDEKQNMVEADKELEEEATAKGNPKEIIEKIHKMRGFIQEVKNRRGELLGVLKPEEQVAEGAALDLVFHRFDEDVDAVVAMENSLIVLRDWDKGTVKKSDKNAAAEKFNFAHQGRYDEGMNKSQEIELDAKNRKDRDKVAAEIDVLVTSYFQPITTIHKGLVNREELQQSAEAKEQQKARFHDESMFGYLKRRISGPTSNIAWLSVYDIVKVYNIYKDAILDKYHSNQKIRTYNAAKNWNVWSPLQPDLDKQARSANEEEVHSFKEFLEKEKFTYDQLFESDGALERNKHNVNRAKAVLEYAADHAWLYHMDRFNGHDVYGVDYEGIFGMRAFEELVEHNNAQQDKESDKGYSRVNNYPEIHMVVDDMIEALERKNLWQVHGMMKRLQEKVKLAESNTWAVTTLMRAMRRHPEILEIMDIGMLDKIGTLGISQSAWALTLFKVQRKKILEMKSRVARGRTTEEKQAIAEACTKGENGIKEFYMLETILKIESLLPDYLKDKKMLTHDGKLVTDYRDLDHEVAKVLSGQTVPGNKGQVISIFDNQIPEFNSYRKYYMDTTNTTPTDPGKTDPDFFNPQNGGSDLLLLGPNEIGNILAHQSQGPWIEENKGLNFVTQVIMRDEDLGEKDKAIQASYRRDVKHKFRLYFDTKVLGQPAAVRTMPKYKTLTHTGLPNDMGSRIGGKIVLDEFLRRGLIDPATYHRIKSEEPEKTTKTILPPDWERRAEDGTLLSSLPPKSHKISVEERQKEKEKKK